jgi:Zinc carboxypeptidase
MHAASVVCDDDKTVAAPDAHPLLDEIDHLIRLAGPLLRHRLAGEVMLDGRPLPLHVLDLGSTDPRAPVLGLFAGVHGLERIGIEVLLAFLANLLRRARWDSTVTQMLHSVRIVAMPLVNPGGLLRGTRANPSGVDLMRNAPVDCASGAPRLVGGHRLSATLPWYRGPAGAPMQPEAQALCDVVEAVLAEHPFMLSVDCHSGFGVRDRLWFPHAHTPEPVEPLAELHALSTLLDESMPHHPYVFEPQSRHYLAHGDLWDHLLLRAAARGGATLLPLTLEMGSWLWVRKNPRQMLSRQGLFNPLILHRQHRVLRRHVALLDFMLRATLSHARWLPAPGDRPGLRQAALTHWYTDGDSS